MVDLAARIGLETVHTVFHLCGVLRLKHMTRRRLLASLPLALLSVAALFAVSEAQRRGERAASVAAATTANFPAAVKPALDSIDAGDLLQHIKVLSSDEFEGRGPGTRGEDLTVRYLTEQFQR